jgi:Flp pilus assembly protein TadD
MFPRTMVALAIAAATAAPALAQSRPGLPSSQTNPYSAYEIISAGDMTRAETVLVRQVRMHPRAPEVALNLASVYLRTGRVDQARTLYRRVMDLPEMAMDMPDGSIRSSHDVADHGMARIGI